MCICDLRWEEYDDGVWGDEKQRWMDVFYVCGCVFCCCRRLCPYEVFLMNKYLFDRNRGFGLTVVPLQVPV